MSGTIPLFRENAECRTCEAIINHITDDGGLVLNQTIFYPSSGGQPGDTGTIRFGDNEVKIIDTVYGDNKTTIIHILSESGKRPTLGDEVTLSLDWERRSAHMRMHTALHLLCSIIPHPVTGGSIGQKESRLDFDMPENIDKHAVSDALMALVNANHPTSTRWITDEELDQNPDLVRTLSVKPPRGSGKIRLVSIGMNDTIDLQPCGGTHVSSTLEIGAVHIGKVEKKGRMNRRLRVRFGPPPA